MAKVWRNICRSLINPHKNLKKFCSQLEASRSYFMKFANSVKNSNRNFGKWADKENSPAIKQTVSELSELLDLYSEVHQRFGVQLKEFQNEFKTILEGEQALTSALNRMNDTQRRKQKIINQIEEAQTKEDNCLEDLRKLWGKLDEIKQQIRQDEIDFQTKDREQQISKMVRLKTGLLEWSNAHKEMSEKSFLIFSGIHDIAQLLPDAADAIQDAEFPNGAAASQIKLSTKEKVQRHIQHNVIERQNVVDRQNVFDRQNVVDRQNVGEDLPPSYDAAVLSLSNLRVAL